METAERQVEDMAAELRQWGERLSKLVATADASGTIAKIDYRNRLDHLRKKYAAAESRFAELKAAGSGKWDAHKDAVEDAWSELAIAFTKLAN